MREQELWKKVPIYFYYLSISKHKDAKDDSAYSTDQIIIAFSKLLEYIMTKGLPERKKDITSSEKVVWLDSYEDLKNGNYDVIFKSAKYNHVRNEIDTETMQERGRRKRPQDGDEEKTHLCIRLAKGENRFLAVHESNHYGITLKCIIDYLNEQFKKFNEDGNDPYHYTIESQIMPGEDFLSSIKRAKTMSVLKLTVYKDDIKDGFMRFAGRTDIADEVDICLKRPKGYKCFPENLIKEYFKDSQDKAKGKIKRIIAYYTDRGKRSLHRTRTVMCIGKYHVRADTLASNDVFPWKPCKQPHPSSLLQGACCFVAHSLSQQSICKCKGFLILDDLVAVCDHA